MVIIEPEPVFGGSTIMVETQRPSGVNVGVNNPGEIVYIQGNETTNGSFRVTLNVGNTAILFEERTAGTWNTVSVSFGTILTEGQVPKALSNGTLIYGDATVDPSNGEWTFDKTINIPAGSLAIGTTIELSEGGQELVVADIVNEKMAFSVNSDFTDATGSNVPNYIDFGQPIILQTQPVFDTTITDNPLMISFPVSITPTTNLRLTDRVVLKANGAMTNVRFSVTDQATGIVIRYIPNKAAFDGDGNGLDMVAGDNTFFLAERGTDTPGNFFLGYVPFVNTNGQILELEIVADAIDLLGNSSGAPFVESEVHEGPNVDLLVSGGVDLETFDVNDAIFPSSDPATANSRNGHPIITYDDTTAESVLFSSIMSDGYDGKDININIDWVAETATTGGVTWGVAFERNAPGGNDIDSDSFDTQQTGTSTTNATSGVITRTTITLTQAEADGIESLDDYRLKLERVVSDGGDDMTGDAQVIRVGVR